MLEPLRQMTEGLHANLLREIDILLEENRQLKITNLELLAEVHRIRGSRQDGGERPELVAA